MKQKHFIDLSKGATPLVVLACMFVYQAWDNPTAWAYLATHGTYGLLWVLKSRIFPDKSWEAPCGIAYGMVILGGLGLYWGTPWMICAWKIEAPLWFIALCVSTFGLGVFLHFAADMQKHATLQLKRGLITDGLFSRCRNPNYLGELLIYGAFSALAMHWYPFVVLAIFMVAIWIPNMIKKDKSISRHEGWEAYKARSGLLFPKLFVPRSSSVLLLLGLAACSSQVDPPVPPSQDGGASNCREAGSCDAGPEGDGGVGLDASVAPPEAGAGNSDAGPPVNLPCGEGGSDCPAGQYCQTPWGSCGEEASQGTCAFSDQTCADYPDPVCGCGGRTLTNQCHARMSGSNILRGGPCGNIDSCDPESPRCHPLIQPICRLPDGHCEGPGYCVGRVEECHEDENFGDVCGCDNRTYDSLCDLRHQGVGYRHTGPCRGRPEPPVP